MTTAPEGMPGLRRGRSYRASVLILAGFLLAALVGLYTATAMIVRVDHVLVPGVEVEVPPPPVPAVVAKAMPAWPPVTQLPGLTAIPEAGSPGTTPVTILIVGIDRRPHHTRRADQPPNADSIHLLTLDPVSRTGSVLALPRDLYLTIPSPVKEGEYWDARINGTYALGEYHKYPGGGAALVRRTIEQVFQLHIDHHIVVDWYAFAEVVDALNGVDVGVPVEITNLEGYNPRDGNAFPISIPAGTVHMDGITALAYSRYRGDPDNDFGRIRRQQDVMRATAQQALQAGWSTQGPALYQRFHGVVETDITLARLPRLIALARLIGPEQVRFVSAAGEQTEAVKRVFTPWGEDVLVPLWDVMGPIVRSARLERSVDQEAAVVTVVNGGGVWGQERRAAAVLSRVGLPPERVLTPPPAPRTGPPQRQTTISYSGEAAETARRVATWLGLPETRVSRAEGEPTVPATVTVTLGQDIRLPDDERFLRYRIR